MEEANRGLSDSRFRLQLPAVTARDPRPHYRVELIPSRVPVHPFIKQRLPSFGTRPETRREDKQCHHTSDAPRNCTAIGIQIPAKPEYSLTEATADDSSQKVRHEKQRDQQRYRSRSDPLPSIWADDSEQNWVLDRRRRKTDHTVVDNLPPIHLPFLRGLDDQQASGWMYHSRPGAPPISYLKDLRHSVLSRNSCFTVPDTASVQALVGKLKRTVPPIVIDEVKSCEELKETPDTTSYSESLWPAVSDDCSTDYGPLSETSPEPDEDFFASDLEPTKGHAMEKVPETEESEVVTNLDENVPVTEITIEKQAEKEIEVAETVLLTDLELPSIATTLHQTPVVINKPAGTQHITSLQPHFASNDETKKTYIPKDSELTEVPFSPSTHTTPIPSEEETETQGQDMVFILHERDTDNKREKTPDTGDPTMAHTDDQATLRKKNSSPTNSNGHKLQKPKADKRRKQAERRRNTEADADENENVVQENDMPTVPEENQGDLQQQEIGRGQSVVATEMKQEETGEVAEGSETRPTSSEDLERKEPQESSNVNVVSMLQSERKRDRERRRVAKREKREQRKRVKEETKQQELAVWNDKEEEIEEKQKESSHHCLHENEVEEMIDETVAASETDSEEERERYRREEEERKRIMIEEMQRAKEEQERQKREEERRRQEELRRKQLEEQWKREEEQRKEEEEMRERIRRQIEATRALALEHQLHASQLKTEKDNVSQGLQITPPFVWSYFPPQGGQTSLD